MGLPSVAANRTPLHAVEATEPLRCKAHIANDPPRRSRANPLIYSNDELQVQNQIETGNNPRREKRRTRPFPRLPCTL